MPVLHGISVIARFIVIGFEDGRHPEQRKNDGEKNKHRGQDQERTLNGGGFSGHVEVTLGSRHPGYLRGAHHGCIKNERGAYERCKRGSQRVKRLRKVQAAGSIFCGTECGYVGVCRHLQYGNAAGKNEQGQQEQRENPEARSGIKQHTRKTHREQPDYDAPFVAHLRYEVTTWYGYHSISGKKGKLDHTSLEVGELKYIP